MRNVTRRSWVIGGVTLLIAVAAVVGLLFWRHPSTNTSSFAPKEVVNVVHQVNFPLYYPTQLPDGFQFDPSSISTTNQVVIFNFTSGTRVISVTEQPASINFNFAQSGGDTHIVAGLGKVTYLSNRQFSGAGIQAAKTSIFLSNPNNTDAGSFALFAESFKLIQP